MLVHYSEDATTNKKFLSRPMAERSKASVLRSWMRLEVRISAMPIILLERVDLRKWGSIERRQNRNDIDNDILRNNNVERKKEFEWSTSSGGTI